MGVVVNWEEPAGVVVRSKEAKYLGTSPSQLATIRGLFSPLLVLFVFLLRTMVLFKDYDQSNDTNSNGSKDTKEVRHSDDYTYTN